MHALQVVDALNQLNVKFSHFDILQNEEVRQALKDYSNWPTYPQIYVKGELLGGCDIVQEMHQVLLYSLFTCCCFLHSFGPLVLCLHNTLMHQAMCTLHEVCGQCPHQSSLIAGPGRLPATCPMRT